MAYKALVNGTDVIQFAKSNSLKSKYKIEENPSAKDCACDVNQCPSVTMCKIIDSKQKAYKILEIELKIFIEGTKLRVNVETENDNIILTKE